MRDTKQFYNPKTKEFIKKHQDHADYIDEEGNRIRIYKEGEISKINHDKLKNTGTIFIKIPIKKGVQFIIEKLKKINLYKKGLGESLIKNGLIFSEIKNTLIKNIKTIRFEESLYEEKKENHLIPNTDEELCNMLKKNIENGATLIALNPREESFFKISNNLEEIASLKMMIKKAHSLDPGFIGILFEKNQTGIENAQKIILSAYDGEGYLIWERNSS